MPPRILVLSASVGAGHLRSAQAIELALKELAPEVHVKSVDVLTLTNAAFRRVYGQGYLDMAQHAPHLTGFIYDMMDRPMNKPASTSDAVRKLLQRANVGKIVDLLRGKDEGQPWDVIVNTHFLPTELIAELRRKRKIETKQITVTTDFDTHRLWVHEPCDGYTTAVTEGARYLEYFGVDPNRIRVTGIPIHLAFSKRADRDACLEKHDLDGSRPVVLQLAGGFGVGPIGQIFEQIVQIETPLQIVAVCGKNEKVRKQVEQIAVPRRHKAKVMGFTTEIDELMAAADIVVTKPGGLTTSESLARGCAIAIANPFPGQEVRNSDFLLENGAAIRINNVPTLRYKLGDLLADPKRLTKMQQAAASLANPRAAYDVAEWALEMAGRK
ncbi:MAG: glycosyltransferase [Tepidisphaeraceae bacterium]